jgi:alpha-glucoside transport system substrate-binding protein
VEFRILGRLEVVDGSDAVPLGGPRQRLVLAHLLLRRNRLVSQEQLIDDVWGESPPPAARNSLQSYVSHLRSALGPGRVEGGSRGYALNVAADELDADRFEALVQEAERRGATDPTAAVSVYEEALGLWRGPVLDDLSGEPSLQPEIARLEELRLAATEESLAAELAVGRHRQLVPDLQRLVARHPFRERLWAELMVALYRSGRQADALAAYRRARELLADELGLEPSPELQRLQSQILRQDPALEDIVWPEVFQVEAEGLLQELPPRKARQVRGPRRLRRIALLLALLIGAVATAAVYQGATNDESSVGTTDNPITVLTPWYAEDVEQRAFLEVVRTFEETTGLEVEVTPTRGNPSRELRERVEADEVPTVAFVFPNVLKEYAREGHAKPLESLGIGEDELLPNYSRTWLDLGTVDGKVYALPVAAGSKSLVWFRPRDFRRMAVNAPRTWDDLVALTRRLARTGEEPWAVGAGDWFTLTDWFENIYVRREGPWKYDGLFAGRLPFDDPSVIAALRRMTSILRDPYLAGGVDRTLLTSFPDAVVDVFGPDPSAHLFMGGGFVGHFALGAVQPAPVPGRSIGVASFPTIDATVGDPVVVGADFIAAFADDEEVKQLLLYLTSPGAGRIWVSTGTSVSPNRRIPLSAYPNELVRVAARQVSEAKIVRFDGSDLLPGSLGREFGLTLQHVLRQPTQVRVLMQEFQRKSARAFNG